MKALNYSLTDIPAPARLAEYDAALQEAVNKLTELNDLLSVYKIGGTSAPGISDLDIIAVFKNNAVCKSDLLSELSTHAKYFFIHNPYGVSEKYFSLARPGIFFHYCEKIYGVDIENNFSTDINDALIKRQIALQFMIKMYIVMTVQKKYNIIKVRSFLLEANGLKYDLEFLNIKYGTLKNIIEEIIDLRKRWFNEPERQSELRGIFSRLYDELEKFLHQHLKDEKLFLPEFFNKKVSGVATISPSEEFTKHHTGTILPSFIASFAGRKYFNLQNRFNKFEFQIPATAKADKSMISYLELVKEMREYNSEHLPHFLPLSSSLRII